MTYTIPYEQIDARVEVTIRKLIEETKLRFPTQDQPLLAWRDIRPEELNMTLTPDTRVWDSTGALVPNTWTRILGAAASPKVPSGSRFLFFGFKVIDDPTGLASIGLGASVRLQVNGTTKAETSAFEVTRLTNNRLYKFNEFQVIDPDQLFDVQFKSPTASCRCIILPIMVRIALSSAIINN